jgi:hypothetical protein
MSSGTRLQIAIDVVGDEVEPGGNPFQQGDERRSV